MSHPCVCGGSNEGCRYCGGRGEIPGRLETALREHARSKKVHGRNKTKQETQMEIDVVCRKFERRAQRSIPFVLGLTTPSKVPES
jgi:hypothetical protein